MPPPRQVTAAQLWVSRQLIEIGKELIEGSRRRVGQAASGSAPSASSADPSRSPTRSGPAPECPGGEREHSITSPAVSGTDSLDHP